MNNQHRTIVNIISFVNKSLAFEWITTGLKDGPYRLVFILLNYEDSALEDFLRNEGVIVYRVHYTGKKTLLPALFKVARILKREKAHTVHCHLFDACVVGLLAAKLVGVKKRIYTRHNSTIHHVYFPRAVKYDQFINYLSTDIIAISEKVKEVLIDMEKAPVQKVRVVPHGFDFRFFEDIYETRITKLRRKYNLEDGSFPVIGVVSRYIHWKGIQYIIPAFKKFLADYPNAVLVLANAYGPYQQELRELLQNQLPGGQYREIEFEDDIIALFKIFDAFVHVPIDDHSEAFGQVYVEALASGVPSIFTLSGIAIEFINNQENALVVDYQNSDDIYTALTRLFTDRELYNKLIITGKSSVTQFSIERMLSSLNTIYQS